MARYTKQSVTSLGGINAELTKLQTAIEDSLSRKGDAPNQMEALLDMNSELIINLADPVQDHNAVNLKTVKELLNQLVGTGACRFIGGDYGSIDDPVLNIIDCGNIDEPITCQQDLGDLPSVVSLTNNQISYTISTLTGGVVPLPFSYELGTNALIVSVNGSIIPDYTETSTTSITITSDALAKYSSDSVVTVRATSVLIQ